ncbi:MAG: biotin/lipoyl-binding protein [Acidimicrobiia bacterium]|nr:biotin/lipoyl-binding protein [Acidimicrobiia bacterium]
MMLPARRRFLILGVIAAVVLAGVLGGRALADSSSQVASFRTATVKRATVSQTEQRSGIIEPVAAGTVAFPISGVVTAVSIQPGQAVTTGQTLATLDTSALQAQLTAQQATLAGAQLTLNNALNGVSTPGNGSSSGSSARNSSTATTSPSSRSSSGSANLGPARQAVTSGQQRVDSAMAAAQAALNSAGSACGASKGSSGSSNGTFKESSAPSSSTTSTTAPQNGTSSQCSDALQSALNAQQQLSSAQSALAKAESTLDSLLSSATSSGSSSQGAGATASTPSLSGPTSAELVADQAAADAAQANVTAAQQDLAQGTIVSPIDGTVAAVNMKAGDHVGAASTTENIVVVGPGGYEVTTTVPVTDIGNVKLADVASVVPDGAGSAIDGKVVSIGVVPTTSGSTTTYPVVIGLNGSPEGLRNGGDADVTITLNQVTGVLAVPTSAVRTAGAGAFHIVQVLTGSTTRTTPVQVGAVGPDLTEIKSGLQEGQQVVIADLNAPLPSNTLTRGFGGGGGLGGGGLGGGGLGGATIGRGG